MKILKKRAFAAVIDGFITGILFELGRVLVPTVFYKSPVLIFIASLFYIFCGDLIFGNASIGKKLLGIRIYDCKTWEKPQAAHLIKRNVLITSPLGQSHFIKSKISDEGVINFLDWERDVLGTLVIDEKIYAKIRAEADEKGGDFCKNMSELYWRYLRSVYMK